MSSGWVKCLRKLGSLICVLKMNHSRNFIHHDIAAIGVGSDVCNVFPSSGIHVQSSLAVQESHSNCQVHHTCQKSGLGLGSESWCSGIPIESVKNVDDLLGPSTARGSANSTQHIWL